MYITCMTYYDFQLNSIKVSLALSECFLVIRPPVTVVREDI